MLKGRKKKTFRVLALLAMVMMFASLMIGVSAYAQDPTEEPTPVVTDDPTAEPTADPTVEATSVATEEPTAPATVEPTEEPAAVVTAEPTLEPTEAPVVEAVVPPAGEGGDTAEVVCEEGDACNINVVDNLWILIAGILVFFMQAGFALVESGFVRARNVTNILMKNFFDLAVASIAYFAIGWGLMYGSGNDFFGTEYFFLSGVPEADGTLAYHTSFFFQLVFAATAATIASGAMAERTEFIGYMVVSALVTAIIYPIIGHWTWGGGWLAQLDTPFSDFAGSTIVHSTGAWVGLMGAIMLGPRKGRFGEDSAPIPGHSMTLAALGVFILWLGWFGFNPGSELGATPEAIGLIAVNTNIAAAGGAVVAVGLGWYFTGVPQLPWGLNGALAGLVAITAGCAGVQPAEALLIGMIGGTIMYFTVVFMESIEIDDPVGAVAVHGAAGVWGTLAVGLFDGSAGLLHGHGIDQLISQVIGIVAVAAFVLVTSGAIFFILKSLGILRVSETGENLGLDIYEHGMVAYPEFVNSPSEPSLSE